MNEGRKRRSGLYDAIAEVKTSVLCMAVRVTLLLCKCKLSIAIATVGQIAISTSRIRRTVAPKEVCEAFE